jgi:hypothetical protein
MDERRTGDDILPVSCLNSLNFPPTSTPSTSRSTFKAAMGAQVSSPS